MKVFIFKNHSINKWFIVSASSKQLALKKIVLCNPQCNELNTHLKSIENYTSVHHIEKTPKILKLLEGYTTLKSEILGDNLKVLTLNDGFVCHIKIVLEGASVHFSIFDQDGESVKSKTFNDSFYKWWKSNCSNIEIIDKSLINICKNL